MHETEKQKKRDRQKACPSNVRKPLLPQLPAAFRTATASTRKRFHLSLGPQRILHSEAASGRRQNQPHQSTAAATATVCMISASSQELRMHTGNTPQGFLLIRCVCLLPSFFSLFFPYYSFLSSFVFLRFQYAGIYEVQKTDFLPLFSPLFSPWEKILRLFCRWQPYFFVFGAQTPSAAWRRLRATSSPLYTSNFYFLPPTHIFFFFTLYPLFQFLFFFCISLSVHLSFLFLFMRIFMCTYRLAFGTQLHQLPLTLFPCICLLVHSFFSSFVLYMLSCIFLYAWIPLHAHSFFYVYPCVYI